MSLILKSKLPSSQESEKGLLGSILLSPSRVLELCQEHSITKDHFKDPANQTIFETILEMREKDKPIDLISVSQFLEDTNRVEQVGGHAYVAELFVCVPTGSNASYYLEVLHEKHVLRSGILAAEKARSELYKCLSLQDAHQIVTSAFQDTLGLFQEREKEDYHTQAMTAFIDKMEAIATGNHKPDLFPTGLPTIDKEAGGMSRGELILIRGLRGVGKSLLGQALIQTNTLQYNRKGVIITLEMPHEQFMRRLIASDGGVSLKSMREGKYDKRELDAFSKSFKRIQAAPLKIFDVFHLRKPTPEVIFSKIRQIHRKHGLDMVMIDHLHRVKFKGGEKRTDESLNEFSRDFKTLCLELQIVGILLAQENTTGGTFGSTQVETDGDGSMSLVPIKENIGGVQRIVGTSAVHIDKFREGDLLGKTIPLTMEGKYARLFETQE